MIVDSPRLRNAFADRNVRTWLVAAVVLLAAVVLGSHASIVWLVLPCAGLAIVAMARQPILGLIATIATAMLIRFELGTGREVSLNLAALLVPATFALWFLIMVRRRDIHLPRSRTTTPLLLFLVASLLSLVVGNGYWDPAVPRPDNLLLVQLGQWGIFVFSAFAFWLMGSLVHDRTWLRRLVFIYLGMCLLAYFYAEKMIFLPQPSSYRDTNRIIKLTSADGLKISAVYLSNPDARYTILYSHGNAEDIGPLGILIELPHVYQA